MGHSPNASVLRAPDISIGGLKDEPGWTSTAPLLAVEYADTGQNEVTLRQKVVELFNAVRRVLARRKLHLSASDNARIDACSNLETLERWLDNAVDAPSTSLALE